MVSVTDVIKAGPVHSLVQFVAEEMRSTMPLCVVVFCVADTVFSN